MVSQNQKQQHYLNQTKREQNTATAKKNIRSPISDDVRAQAPGLRLFQEFQCPRQHAGVAEDGHQGVHGVQVRQQGGVRALGQLLEQRHSHLPLTTLLGVGWGGGERGF